MGESLPKAVKVWMAANILAIEFDNGQTRYLRSHNIKSLKKGKGKRVNLILPPTWQWLGSNARIEKDGSVILFEKDSYTPQELWNNSKERIDLVSGVN